MDFHTFHVGPWRGILLFSAHTRSFRGHCSWTVLGYENWKLELPHV